MRHACHRRPTAHERRAGRLHPAASRQGRTLPCARYDQKQADKAALSARERNKNTHRTSCAVVVVFSSFVWFGGSSSRFGMQRSAAMPKCAKPAAEVEAEGEMPLLLTIKRACHELGDVSER